MTKKHSAMTQDAAWVITEAGLAQYQNTLGAMSEKLQAYNKYDEDEPERPESNLLRIEGDVGIIDIKGTLTNSDSWVNEFFGLVSYTAIRSAMIEAATNPSIRNILLDIDSPGGAVNGVADASELISTIDKTLKPVYAFTDGNMASGAYWMGSSARKIYTAQTASIGSIGVVMNVMERSKMLANAGITPHVIRAGRYKQIGNPNEPLTEEGRAELQGMVDSIYKIFVSHISEQRGKSYDYADKVMAQGRVFLGESAVEVGLADEIMGFDAVLAVISAKQVDRSSFSFENNGIGANMSNKKPLVSAVQAALVAAGHIPAGITEPSAEDLAAITAALADAPVVPAVTTEADAAPEADEKVEIKIDDFKVETSNEAITILTEQLKERDDQLIDVKVENRTLAKQVETLEASMSGLKSIAVKSINAMQVALNQGTTSFEASSATDILAAHANVSTDFTKNYKVGGVAAVEPNTQQSFSQPVSDSQRAARLNATKL